MTDFPKGQMLGTGVKGRHAHVDSWNRNACSDLLKLRAAYSLYRAVSYRTTWRQLIALVRAQLKKMKKRKQVPVLKVSCLRFRESYALDVSGSKSKSPSLA